MWALLMEVLKHLFTANNSVIMRKAVEHFLAHLWWAKAMTWRPSSISKACFVRNRQGYFNETWCEDTFGQYAQTFFYFCDLTHFVASRRPCWKSDFCHLKANGCS
jgi:hypothetical protein